MAVPCITIVCAVHKSVYVATYSRHWFLFKQNYAQLDWQNSEQHPIKAPDNEWFTVQYSEVRFDSTN